MFNYKKILSDYVSCNLYGGMLVGDIPIIKKQTIDVGNIELISCTNTKYNDLLNSYKGVHFFVHDERFASIFNHPERSLEKYRQYAFLLSPDFSLYADMSPEEQFASIIKNRSVGAFWQAKGLTVIPTMSWSTPISYEYCYLGVEIGSIVAISTIGCKRNNKERFMRGYQEMIARVKPQYIICFGKPFREMEGPLIVIDY